ncbi:UPF0280 family protein [Seohaeicola nanhaiensis]|uniref:UPF0280 family protein n=1 Tax=Seohaeicola nanhaiensis TaxID=1387282 RepID=A0ABV9KB78_9RHOB
MSHQAAMLPDGRRLHLHHGPIDLVIGAEGAGRAAALRAAETRFASVMDELVAELPLLRSPADPGRRPTGVMARRMHAAVLPFLPAFITPMAAVAGAVADEILAAMTAAGPLETAYVNNGGDVALHVAPGHSLRAAIAAGLGDRATIRHADPVRGVATSGRGGRSFSLGIADSGTVLAACAAEADAAATMIANAVDLPGHPAIIRVPAHDISPDSDLGARLVTRAVGPLSDAETARALAAGLRAAQVLHARGLIAAALLTLNGARRIAGAPGLIPDPAKEATDA